MPATSLSVVIGGICAALTLIVALGRSLLKAVAEAQLNTKNLATLNEQTQDQDRVLGEHAVRLAVLEDRDSRDGGNDNP
jgi:hypothetical protein